MKLLVYSKLLYPFSIKTVFENRERFFEKTNYSLDKRKSVSKEHRPNPIAQMGLFMNNNGLPITYKLFPGNANDCLTYRPNFGRILEWKTERKYSIGKLLNALSSAQCTLLQQNYYLFNYYDEILKEIGIATGIDFSRYQKVDNSP